MANFHKYIEFRILETMTCMGCNREEKQSELQRLIYSEKGPNF